MKQHSSGFLSLVNETKQAIQEITPSILKSWLDDKKPIIIIDVREADEWQSSGHIASAKHLSKGIIERDIEKQFPDKLATIVTYCSGGFRCALVAYNLERMGYKNIFSLDTGLQGWIDAGYTLEELE